MIAALAAGVLGQLEGMGSISSGISALLGRPAPSGGDYAAAEQAAGPAGPVQGLGSTGSALSSQLQNLLLQQQEQSDLPQAVRVDQMTGPPTVG